MAAEGEAAALEFTPTWIVAAVCSLIVLLSLVAERCLHYLGKVCICACDRCSVFLDSLGHSVPYAVVVHGIDLRDRPVLQTLKKKNQKPLFEALIKVKEGAPHFFSLFFAPTLIAGGLHAQMV